MYINDFWGLAETRPSYNAEYINMKVQTAVIIIMYVLKCSTPAMDVNVLVHQIRDLKLNQAHAPVHFCGKGLQFNIWMQTGNPDGNWVESTTGLVGEFICVQPLSLSCGGLLL